MKMKYNVLNLWNARNAVLRGKFITIQAYLKKQEKSQVNDLTLFLKELEKRTQNQQKEIIIRVKINEIETLDTRKNQ